MLKEIQCYFGFFFALFPLLFCFPSTPELHSFTSLFSLGCYHLLEIFMLYSNHVNVVFFLFHFSTRLLTTAIFPRLRAETWKLLLTISFWELSAQERTIEIQKRNATNKREINIKAVNFIQNDSIPFFAFFPIAFANA